MRTKEACRSSTHASSTPSWNIKEEFRQHTRHIEQTRSKHLQAFLIAFH
ncbi:TPA: hypothetical protein N0F65_013026 [Lagenidium giganteum]|uniref:Uncharacterized protein n=1 Tax=Lagenidium giganteum TaxID=4803 RepID=A0AAV2YQE2_9STRA|nr:TPA: hypothetical protein N0F65_013026 [Lagenidium giganteum]